ncbi:MAG: GNAT family N-acetyltransferase [Eubacterium sp.]|nr:GNAT family N-acetyltransferase [Eubacterium sp.]
MKRTYLVDGKLIIRNMRHEDPKIFFDTYLSYGWHPNLDTYTNYYQEQEEGKRKVFVAEYEGNVVGICTLVLNSAEGPWGNKGYPEIVDLSVFLHVHNKGIGSRLLDVVESEAFKISDMVYLAVGLHSGYGSAQRLYVKRGYIPDGNGVWYQGNILEQYAPCCNDDDLFLYMSKSKEFR